MKTGLRLMPQTAVGDGRFSHQVADGNALKVRRDFVATFPTHDNSPSDRAAFVDMACAVY